MRNPTNKVALCCIAKLENQYIRNFIDFYLSIGVDHFFIYDHNAEDEEDFNDVIGDYVVDGICEIIPWQDHAVRIGVTEAYTDCTVNHHLEYDYILFLDPDEFIWLAPKYNNNIKEYLYQFTNVHAIALNWITYDDNDLIFYDPRPVQERFTRQVTADKNTGLFKNLPCFHENYHIKCVINCMEYDIEAMGNDIEWRSPHYPSIKDSFNTQLVFCNSDGEPMNYLVDSKIPTIQTDNAYLRHYRCKTIQEYCENKLPKLTKFGYIQVDFDDNFFFDLNNWSQEKQDFYDNYLKDNNPYWIDDSKNEDPKGEIQYSIISCKFGSSHNYLPNTNLMNNIYPNINYVFVTDDKSITSNIWNIVYVQDYPELADKDTMYLVKYVKTHPFEFVSTKYAIYMDSSIGILESPDRLMYNFIQSNKSIGLMFHPDRDNINDEIDAWAIRTQDADLFQLKDMYTNTIEEYVLFFCCLILYKNDVKTYNITYNWWNILTTTFTDKIIRSDQIILPITIELLRKEDFIDYHDIFFIAPNIVNATTNYFIRYGFKNGRPDISYFTERGLCKYGNKIIKAYNINRSLPRI